MLKARGVLQKIGKSLPFLPVISNAGNLAFANGGILIHTQNSTTRCAMSLRNPSVIRDDAVMPLAIRRDRDRGDASKVVGFTCGAFNPFPHPGHVQMLEEAHSVCDHLIVGLQTDPTIDRPQKQKPLCSVEERRIMLEAIRWVDQVEEYSTEESLVALLERLQPDVRILGADYVNKRFTGDHLDIQIYFNRRDHHWSSTAFIERIRQAHQPRQTQIRLAGGG